MWFFVCPVCLFVALTGGLFKVYSSDCWTGISPVPRISRYRQLINEWMHACFRFFFLHVTKSRACRFKCKKELLWCWKKIQKTEKQWMKWWVFLCGGFCETRDGSCGPKLGFQHNRSMCCFCITEVSPNLSN